MNTPKKLRYLLWPLIMLLIAATAAMLAAPSAASAQIASDSVQVEIISADDITVTISPDSYSGLVGDTVTFSATAIDEFTGEEVTAVYDWSASDPDAVEITTVENDGSVVEVVFVGRGSITIRVNVEQVSGILVGELQEGGSVYIFQPGETLQMEVGQSTQLCFYLTNPEGNIVARNDSVCPLPASSPAWAPIVPGMIREYNTRVG